MRLALPWLAPLALLGACASAPPTEPLAEVTLAPLPDWTDRYAASNSGDMRFFEIEGLMDRYQLSRLAAVEVQNHYRDLSRAAAPGGPSSWFEEALRRARSGELEAGRDLAARLEAAPFIVVFDLDETLWDQRIASPEGCHDFEVPQAKGAPRPIQLTPGWRRAFERIRALGGLVVLFSANLDDPTWAALRLWTFDDRPLPEQREVVGGVLTNSYLVRQSKHEGPGKAHPGKGEPVMEASKDLRLFDPSLERVIIVDDNPLRLFQPRNVRVFPAFDADLWCSGRAAGASDPGAAALSRAWDGALDRIVGEIEESWRYAQEAHVSFAKAFRPYSQEGDTWVKLLMEAHGWSRAEAATWLRGHPGAAP